MFHLIGYCQCTFPDLWLEVADTNPISDLTLTFPYGNKAAVVSFKENNDAGDILTLYYEGDRGPSLVCTSHFHGDILHICKTFPYPPPGDVLRGLWEAPAEKGHVIAVFLAIDGDHGINQPIRYELREGNENIDLCPQTGNLTLVKQIDRDVYGAKSYVLEFEIFAIEDDFSSESITGDVLMTVTDVNDNIPTFSYSGPYTVWVPEGTAGTIIFNHFIEVTDRDFGINGSYSAEIIIEDLDVATEKLQIINTLTGTPKGSQVTNYSIICIDKNFLDYKFETEINFKVKVTEDADISHFSEANFTITLEEINDKVDVDDEQLYMVLFYVTATILVIIVIAITAMYIMKVRRYSTFTVILNRKIVSFISN
ncbi:cadherin-23-like [Artemia franciscana]|uniref:cadherin-23-like n=1 Tax=Artemia franciscana TaxID=6661 RepID=UPI0032DA94F3